tara:strand:- start:1298 stop:1630 length:333 start_codon:yes stop_codon:yes gene_type:complete
VVLKINKKGMDISLNFVILAVLALIALILIALFFTGGLSNLFQQTEEVGDTDAQQIALAETECKTYCTLGTQNAYDKDFDEDEAESLGADNCEGLLGKSFEELQEDDCEA